MLNGSLRDVFAADTSNVYINQGHNLLKYNGDTLTEILINDPGFITQSIDGFDNDNFFLGGGHNIQGGFPTLKKFQNGNFFSYSITNDNGNSIYDVLCLGPNEAWFSTISSNYLYRFYFGNIEQYELDDSVFTSYFFNDITGKIYAFGVRTNHFIDSGAVKISQVLFSYKFENNRFNYIRIDTIYSSFTGPNKTDQLHRCGEDLIMLHAKGSAITRFTGNDWVNYLGLPPEPQFIYSHIGGSSKDFLIFFAAYNWLIYIWNGNWSKEDSFDVAYPPLDPLVSKRIVMKEPNVYFTISSFSSPYSYFVIGRKNKKIEMENLKD